jgi:phosphatidylethanolamine N-methyltransferase
MVQVVLYVTGALPPAGFLVLFACWRLCYNGGLGLLLHRQSESKWFSRQVAPWLAERSPLQAFLRRQLEAKMGRDYDFDVRCAVGWCGEREALLTA